MVSFLAAQDDALHAIERVHSELVGQGMARTDAIREVSSLVAMFDKAPSYCQLPRPGTTGFFVSVSRAA